MLPTPRTTFNRQSPRQRLLYKRFFIMLLLIAIATIIFFLDSPPQNTITIEQELQQLRKQVEQLQARCQVLEQKVKVLSPSSDEIIHNAANLGQVLQENK